MVRGCAASSHLTSHESADEPDVQRRELPARRHVEALERRKPRGPEQSLGRVDARQPAPTDRSRVAVRDEDRTSRSQRVAPSAPASGLPHERSTERTVACRVVSAARARCRPRPRRRPHGRAEIAAIAVDTAGTVDAPLTTSAPLPALPGIERANTGDVLRAVRDVDEVNAAFRTGRRECVVAFLERTRRVDDDARLHGEQPLDLGAVTRLGAQRTARAMLPSPEPAR